MRNACFAGTLLTRVKIGCMRYMRMDIDTFVAHCPPTLAPRPGRNETLVFVFLIKERVP